MESQSAIQQMDITSLKAVMADISDFIVPSRFEQAQQPEPSTIQIGLRTLDGLKWLELSWSAEAARLVQTLDPPRIGSESTLAKQIKFGLRQMALVEIKQKGFERIIEFGLAERPGLPIKRRLILEAMGRHSNLIFLDQNHKVIAIGRQIRENKSRLRPICTGDIYTYPPPLKGIEPDPGESQEAWEKRLKLIPNTLGKALQETYQGVSPSLTLQLADNEKEKAQCLIKTSTTELSNQTWNILYQNWLYWINALISKDFHFNLEGPTDFRVWGAKNKASKDSKNISFSLDYYYKSKLERNRINKVYNEIEMMIYKFTNSELSILELKERQLEEAYNNSSIKKTADQLMCIQPLTKALIVKAQKLYSKAKKYKRSIPKLVERISYHEQRLKAIRESKSYLEEISNNNWEKGSERLEILIELKEELDYSIFKRKKYFNKKEKKKQFKSRPLEIFSPKGLTIQIGRNHTQNELISIIKSRKGDLWFHAQECPGSHVVLKASNGFADQEDIQLAADLAAFFSKAKGNTKVPIIVVSANKLRRIIGAVPGTVSHEKGEVLWGYPSVGMKEVSSTKLQKDT